MTKQESMETPSVKININRRTLGHFYIKDTSLSPF